MYNKICCGQPGNVQQRVQALFDMRGLHHARWSALPLLPPILTLQAEIKTTNVRTENPSGNESVGGDMMKLAAVITGAQAEALIRAVNDNDGLQYKEKRVNGETVVEVYYA
jgi:hypothetical protein